MTRTDKPRHTVVVGGGIIGISTSIWLLRAGHRVTLIDRGDAVRRASFGNAGILAACSIAPVTMPGLIRTALTHTFDPDYPLFLRKRYLPRLAPWLARYLSHCTALEAARISRALAPLLRDTVMQHRALAQDTDAARWIKDSDYLFAYPSRASFEQDRAAWRLRQAAGFVWQEFDGQAVRLLDPAFGPSIGYGVLVPDHGIIVDPGRYLDDLNGHAAALGAILLRSEARGFRCARDGSLQAVIHDAGVLEADHAVIATGAWSKGLVLPLGLKVPLESERGYHLMLRETSQAPRFPTMIAAGKFAATPMANGVRCAGIIEFGGLEAPAQRKPIDLIARKLREAFPAFTFGHYEEWLGHRPAPSDSLPLIGPVPGHRGIYLAFGHHHIGMTSGPKTGRLLAAMITGASPELDMAPYSPSRFAR